MNPWRTWWIAFPSTWRSSLLRRVGLSGGQLPAPVVGLRFALVEAGLAQVIYLVMFSYAFFIQGFTGLAITIGCIVTLFVVMQLTARIRWSERFSA